MMKNNMMNIYVLGVIIISLGMGMKVCVGDWCIVSTVPSDEELKKFLDYGCSRYDCSPILPGGACFNPNIMQAHTSWILDKVYREEGWCQPYLGYRTPFNPCKCNNIYSHRSI